MRVPTAVVFGARPGGIGAALAERLPRALGVRAVALVARTDASVRATAARLGDRVPGVATLPLTADLACEAAVETVADALARTPVPGSSGSYLEGLRVVVFAAGTVVADHGDAEALRRMHAIKAIVAPRLVRRLTQAPVDRGDGARTVVLVGSITALVPVPSLQRYGESNVALLELARSLEPRRARGLSCTYCAPAYLRNGSLRRQIDAELANPLARQAVWTVADPVDAAADETLAAASAGARLVIPGRAGKVLHGQYRIARSLGAAPLFRLAQEVGARWAGFG